jgi:hypothetical protein
MVALANCGSCIELLGAPPLKLDGPETFAQKPARSHASGINSSSTFLQRAKRCEYSSYEGLP